MRNFHKRGDGSLTLYCFSPLATLITFLIEISFAIYTAVRYRRSRFGGLSVLMLLFLAFFQIAEYELCEGARPISWIQIAFLSITALPPLGVHLASLATKKTFWVPVGYAFGAAYEALIIFAPSLFLAAHCTGRFVIFDSIRIFEWTYGVYYLGLIVVAIALLVRALWTGQGNAEVVKWLLASYASFVVPASFLYAFFERTRAGFSSIMCGFAIIFAFILVFKILPHYAQVGESPAFRPVKK